MLTSDKLSALDNMSMWMVNGDFKSCNKKKGQKETSLDKWNAEVKLTLMHRIDFIQVPENQKINIVISN